LQIERPGVRAPSLRHVVSDFGSVYGTGALAAFIFAASGPVAIVLTIATHGGLGQSDVASWLFGAFLINGLVSIAFCWLYREPLVLLWSIPGTVLVGPALTHLTFPEVIGAFFATGVLMLVLGLSGWVRRCMEMVPMPVVMGMVSGVFLRFALDLVYAMRDRFWIAAPMVVVFFAVSAAPVLAPRVPPLIAAMIVGAVMVVALGEFHPAAGGAFSLARPNLHAPAFSWQAMVELVVPLAIAVLVVQNGQGIAVLRAAGHHPPVNAITAACGAISMLTAFTGTVSTCLTGPVNAVISSVGARQRQYTAGIGVGILAVGFGILSPTVTHLMLATPPAFISALAGLAILRVLQAAFVVAFAERHTLGALTAFIVTVADVTILNIGAPFWGLVFGFAVSRLLERRDGEPAGT
jgi:benzoate membrane transport protein